MIRNITKKTVIAKETKFCKGINKYIGLMFSKKIKDKALVFDFKSQKVSIHMFFVFFPIDLIFLNENKIVVEIKESLKPFQVYKPKKKVRYLIEVQKGVIGNSKTKVNDILEF